MCSAFPMSVCPFIGQVPTNIFFLAKGQPGLGKLFASERSPCRHDYLPCGSVPNRRRFPAKSLAVGDVASQPPRHALSAGGTLWPALVDAKGWYTPQTIALGPGAVRTGSTATHPSTRGRDRGAAIRAEYAYHLKVGELIGELIGMKRW